MVDELNGLNLPCSILAEKSVLGCVLSDNGKRDVLSEVSTTLRAEHFYIELHANIYRVMLRLSLAGKKLDTLVILNECIKENIFSDESEAVYYAKQLMDSAPSASAIVEYANIVVEKSMLRSLIIAAKDIINEASSENEPTEKVIDHAEHKIYGIREGEQKSGLTHIGGVVFDRIKELLELTKESQKNGGKPMLKGLSTGFSELDDKIYGLNESDLIILAARPGMGKTSFAMNIAVNVSKKYRDKAVCVFSLEMSKEQLVSRMISSEALVPTESMRTGIIPVDRWTGLTESAEVLSQLMIYIDDTPACGVNMIKSKLRRINNLGVVIIDYLQLMTSSIDYHGNRVAEISEITRDLKVLAKELNVPVIALSQLARNSERREDKRPLLSDLRDSGSIEQDADIVMFLYRNSYYDKNDPNKELCECNVAKNRHGETGVARIGWKGEFTKFVNVEFKQANG